MPSLQIRNLPDDVYQALSLRAEQAHRSLSQQALIELRAATASSVLTRRKQVLQHINADLLAQGTSSPASQPEELLREDRER